MDAIMKFYRSQWRRYLLPCLLILVLDFLLLFVCVDLPHWRNPIVAVLSGSLGGFVRFMIAEQIPFENLNDTTNMFRYWSSLIVGSVLGFFSYLLLVDGRLLKIAYPTVPMDVGLEPSAVSAAIIGGLAGLLAKELVAAGQKRIK